MQTFLDEPTKALGDLSRMSQSQIGVATSLRPFNDI